MDSSELESIVAAILATSNESPETLTNRYRMILSRLKESKPAIKKPVSINVDTSR